MSRLRSSMRRSRRTRLAAFTTTATVLGLVGASPLTLGVASAHQACSVTATQLPDLGYGGSALAFNHSLIVGGVLEADGTQRPAAWRDGQLILLDDTVGAGEAQDINWRGQIVTNADDDSASVVLTPGRPPVILHNVPGSSGPFSIYGRRINAWGEVAGAAAGLNTAARWNSPSALPVPLAPATGYSYSFSKGINEWGWVAGDSDEADFTPHASVWDSQGRVRVFSGAFGANSPGQLFEINNHGESAGESFLPGANGPTADEATVWSRDGRPTGLGYLPGDNQSTALGLSSDGAVAGESSTLDYATGSDGNTHAFFWPGHGSPQLLPTIGLSYADSSSTAHQIEGDTVVGTAGTAALTHPYVWKTCSVFTR